MSDRIIYTTPLDPLARPLIDELSHEYESRYGEFYQQDGGPREMDKYAPELFSPAQGGNFVLLLRDGQAIGGGAFKRHDDPHTAELKRVWTHSALRRQGLAGRVLQPIGQRQPEAQQHAGQYQ